MLVVLVVGLSAHQTPCVAPCWQLAGVPHTLHACMHGWSNAVGGNCCVLVGVLARQASCLDPSVRFSEGLYVRNGCEVLECMFRRHCDVGMFSHMHVGPREHASIVQGVACFALTGCWVLALALAAASLFNNMF